jgi:hypothetical protein
MKRSLFKMIASTKQAPKAIPAEIVADPATFRRLHAECGQIIDNQKLLPDFVFRKPLARYFALEYYVAHGELGGLLSEVAATCGDERVNYITIDPHPVDCYYKRNSWFGLVSFDPSTIVDRYAYVLGGGAGHFHLLAGVNYGAFWGSSLKWAIAADRFRWELVVLAMPENIKVDKIGRFRCFDESMLASYEKSQYQSKDPSGSIASEFMKKFRANYQLSARIAAPSNPNSS